MPGGRSLTLFGLAAVSVLVLAVASFAVGDNPDVSDPLPTQQPPATTAEPTPSPTSGPPTPTPTVTVDASSLVRLRIPKFGIDAPTVELGLIPRTDGQEGLELDTPDDKDSVGWYSFTAQPGRGNAVMSAHVDWYTGEEAVFWHLKDLEMGDQVVAKLADGTEIVYSVDFKREFPVEEVPVGSLLEETPTDQVTLITCGGEWNGTQYTTRVVVIAKRVEVRQPVG